MMQDTVLLERRILRPRLQVKHVIRLLAELLGGAFLLSIGAHIEFVIPFTPVPFTLQTLFLAYLILVLKRKAWRTVAAYILMGLCGIPVYAYGGGVLYILSPTFGYILGFLVASIIVGYYVSPLVHPRKLVLGSIMIPLIVYLLGFSWLSLYLAIFVGQNPVKAVATAIIIGIVPFIIWDFMKAVAAVALFYTTNRLVTMIKYGK